MERVGEFTIEIEHVPGGRSNVEVIHQESPVLRPDEPATLADDAGVLAIAIGDCVMARLLFLLSRQGTCVNGLRTSVGVQFVRNDNDRLRIGAMQVTVHPHASVSEEAMALLIPAAEDFCLVTQSVREGLEIQICAPRRTLPVCPAN